MTKKQYFVTHSAGCCICDSISRELEDGSFEELSYEEIVNRLNEQNEVIENTKEIITTIIKIATNNGVISKKDLLKVINND